MNIKITPLTESHIEESFNLIISSVEIEDDDIGHPDIWLPASVNPEKYQKYYSKNKTVDVAYYTAIDEATGRVVGTIGDYNQEEDVDEASWVAWFVVDKHYRNKGIGNKLFNFILDKMKNKGKKYLRLYTSTSPLEKDAQRFYEKRGVKIFKEEQKHGDKNKTLYREILLLRG